jgi:hypothetical protein|tara:strand:+ start:23587 stop:24843 length:1257 start_codon:yes stop_codon:yes gene_type:complete
MKKKLNRRTFLRGAGVSLALPWLESMQPAWGEGTDAPPERMVCICTALGLHGPALYPETTEPNYEATEYLNHLKRHRNDFTLFSGLSHVDQGGEHATELTFLSGARNPGKDGFQNSVSVDQVAARHLGHVTRFPSVMLSSEGPDSQSYNGSGVMVPAEYSPARLFTNLFLQGNARELRLQKLKLTQGKSILDELREQAKSMQQTATAADRDRLNEYFSSIRDAEQNLAAAQVWLDRPKPKTTALCPQDIHDKADLIGRTRLLFQMIPLILQTDSSRVVSVFIQDHHVAPKIEGVESEHHNLSHHGRDQVKIEQLKKIETAILGCYGELLDQLKTKEESGSRILDKTTVMFGSNLGNANAHDPSNLPVFLAGGGFQHGNYVAFDRKNNQPLSNLYVTMLNKMGVPTESFATSTGALSWS